MDKQRKDVPYGQIARRRTCLMCRETFSSEGAHHRICDRCKASRAWRDG